MVRRGASGREACRDRALVAADEATGGRLRSLVRGGASRGCNPAFGCDTGLGVAGANRACVRSFAGSGAVLVVASDQTASKDPSVAVPARASLYAASDPDTDDRTSVLTDEAARVNLVFLRAADGDVYVLQAEVPDHAVIADRAEEAA